MVHQAAALCFVRSKLEIDPLQVIAQFAVHWKHFEGADVGSCNLKRDIKLEGAGSVLHTADLHAICAIAMVADLLKMACHLKPLLQLNTFLYQSRKIGIDNV